MTAALASAPPTLTILIVDDTEDTRELWALVFREEGFRVLTADSCATALGVLRQENERIDFVVSDYWLGDGLGEAMLREAVAIGALRPGSALICTGLHAIEKSSYAARVLYKPIAPDELIACVRELLPRDTPAVA